MGPMTQDTVVRWAAAFVGCAAWVVIGVTVGWIPAIALFFYSWADNISREF